MGLHQEQPACCLFRGPRRDRTARMLSDALWCGPSSRARFRTTIHERPDDAWSFDLDLFDSNIRGIRMPQVTHELVGLARRVRENRVEGNQQQNNSAVKFDRPSDTSLPENLGVLCPPGTRAFRELFL